MADIDAKSQPIMESACNNKETSIKLYSKEDVKAFMSHFG